MLSEIGPSGAAWARVLVATLLDLGEGVAEGRRGRKRQLEVEARYWQLLQSGMGTVEACRRVGITRKPGYRWRAGPPGTCAWYTFPTSTATVSGSQK